MSPILSVENLIVQLKSSQTSWLGVNDFSFHVNPQETVCITGESGAGKTLTILAILGLLPLHASVLAGNINFTGKNLLGISDQQIRDIRGKEIGVVFQEPGTALNPVMKIGDQLMEIFRRKEHYSKKQAQDASLALLEQVGFHNSLSVFRKYSYQLSGGMQQRILIAMAISRNPKLLIADEPTTALDTTIQAQIVELIEQLKADIGLSVLWITHDLSLASRIADRTVIIYAGKTMEAAPTETILATPYHPYTQGLLQSMPQYALRHGCHLQPIKGICKPSDSQNRCVFYTRCDQARPYCKMAQPPLKQIRPHHQAACWFHQSVVTV
ncbi:MAG: ABC transporter ATP-binding protein [Anaerolineaceae bacterium]|nr:ABC transporter ATP-binding protein [Anaerolineaceae bacterium]